MQEMQSFIAQIKNSQTYQRLALLYKLGRDFHGAKTTYELIQELRSTHLTEQQLLTTLRQHQEISQFKQQLTAQVNLGPDEIGLICAYGIGDTYFVCALAQQISAIHGQARIVVVVKPEHSDIPDLFQKHIARKVTLDRTVLAKICDSVDLIREFSHLAPGQLFFAHPRARLGMQLDILGYKEIHLVDLYRVLFSLKPDRPLLQPAVTEAAWASARQRFQEYEFPEKRTVLLSPEATSTGILSETLWQAIAEYFCDRGYKVILLVSPNSYFLLPGLPRVYFPLSEAIPFTELCGTVISLRSGFCDLIATAQTNLVVLYPDQAFHTGTVYTCASLRLMQLSSSAQEIIVSDDTSPEQVLNQLSSSQTATAPTI